MIIKNAETLDEHFKNIHTIENTVSNIDYRKESTSWKKDQFRKSYEWKRFCKHMISIRNNQCEICHTNKDLIVHHKDPIRYADLSNVNNFAVLCCSCHLKVEANCKSQELMDAHPEYKKWYTLYPYSYDNMKWQSGYLTIKKWDREIKAEINKPENVVKIRQRNEALAFMKKHPELFQ